MSQEDIHMTQEGIRTLPPHKSHEDT